MVAVPPELVAEAQKFERYNAQNPQGRYFVPLANTYRKMREFEKAEALLREGLRRHPDYLSAHIVLGRCLADRGATEDAAGEFRYVLSMDPQNLIALRYLGEMASEGGRNEEAIRWYRELLAVDPLNEDARQALDALESAPVPSALAPEEDFEGSAMWWTRPEEETGAGELPPSGLVDDDLIWNSGTETDEPGPQQDEVLSWGAVDLAATDVAETPVDTNPLAGVADVPFDGLELTDDTGGFGGEPADSWTVEDAGGGWETLDGIEVAPEPGLSEVDDESPPEAAEEGDGFVTETIADLYARQGFYDRAADVYRELIRRRGGDETLESRLRDVERLASGEVNEEPAAGSEAGFMVETDTDDLPLLEWSVAEEELSPAGFPAAFAPVVEEGGDPFADSFEAGFGDGADAHLAADDGEAASEAEEVAAIFAREEEAFIPVPEEARAEAGEVEVEDEPVVVAAAAAGLALDEPAAEVEPQHDEPPAPEHRSVHAYLSGLAAWQPVVAAAPLAEEPAPEVAESADDLPWLPVPGADEDAAMDIGGLLAEEEAAVAEAPGEDDLYPWEISPAGAAPAAEAAVEPAPSSAFSFEEFFAEAVEAPGAPASGSETAAPEPPAAPPAPPSGGGEGDDEDLESFQAWLQSLKR